MNHAAANPKNDALARELRARAAKLDDPELRTRAERIATIVESTEKEAPRSLLNLAFRKPTSAEKQRGTQFEAMARKILSAHGRVVA